MRRRDRAGTQIEFNTGVGDVGAEIGVGEMTPLGSPVVPEV